MGGEGVGGMSKAPTVNAGLDGSVLVDGQVGECLRHELVARPVGAFLASVRVKHDEKYL